MKWFRPCAMLAPVSVVGGEEVIIGPGLLEETLHGVLVDEAWLGQVCLMLFSVAPLIRPNPKASHSVHSASSPQCAPPLRRFPTGI